MHVKKKTERQQTGLSGNLGSFMTTLQQEFHEMCMLQAQSNEVIQSHLAKSTV